MKTFFTRSVVVLVTAILMIAASSAQQLENASGYQFHSQFRLSGTNPWDHVALDEASHRLYVTRDTYVDVLDTSSGELVGQILNTEGVHGVALAPDLGRGFTSNGRANTVTIFDLSSLKPVGTVKLDGQSPDGIVYDRFSRLVFTLNTNTHTITAIRAESGAIAKVLKLVDVAEAAVSDGQGHLYVNVGDPAELVVVDTARLKVERRILLAPCIEPRGVSIDVKNHRVFSACSNGMMVVTDAKARKTIAHLPIAHGVDDVVFDPQRGLLYGASSSGNISVIRENSPNQFAREGDIHMKRGTHSMAVESETGKIFVPVADFSQSRIYLSSNVDPDSLVVIALRK